MYKLSNKLLPKVPNELYVKKNKIHQYPTIDVTLSVIQECFKIISS